MCGIAGSIGCGQSQADIDWMLSQLHHRGPDATGSWCYSEQDLVLGHKRLSIIDLGHGHQPMHSPCQRYVLSFNGEIYNYKELRPNLTAKGWSFQTESDTEVLLAGLIAYGLEFLHQTVGMFAFAFWDGSQQALYLVRDRIGVKPLYYAQRADGGVVFASELKSIIPYVGSDPEINTAALEAYLTVRYTPAPQTMIEPIQKLLPGHYLEIKQGQLRLQQYWQIAFSSQNIINDEMALVEEISLRLREAVRIRLRGDVPFGLFLSGGVDSGLIATQMQALASEPVRSYSIGFQDQLNECSQAKALAKTLGLIHTEIEMTPNDLYHLPKVAWYMDEPFPDPIILAMYQLAEAAKRDVKVILTGEGADELFAGYAHQGDLALLAQLAAYIPQPLLGMGGAIAARLPMMIIDRIFQYPVSPGVKARDRLSRLLRQSKAFIQSYLTYVSIFPESDRQQLYSASFVGRVLEQDRIESYVKQQMSGEDLDSLLDYEYHNWLPENILLKQDKMLMAHSLEGRVPFCDHRLVELCAQLPKYTGIGKNKWLLRKVAQQTIPAFDKEI